MQDGTYKTKYISIPVAIGMIQEFVMLLAYFI
ncbi:MAG: hypothetical protein H6Q20_21 [Bacteroidetes bacterium]|jgi:hypothetical protein|nr:hypothetical protein [Bacteroidota bacterium]